MLSIESECVVDVPDHRPYHDHLGASCAFRHGCRDFASISIRMYRSDLRDIPLTGGNLEREGSAISLRCGGVWEEAYMAAVLPCLGETGRL